MSGKELERISTWFNMNQPSAGPVWSVAGHLRRQWRLWAGPGCERSDFPRPGKLWCLCLGRRGNMAVRAVSMGRYGKMINKPSTFLGIPIFRKTQVPLMVKLCQANPLGQQRCLNLEGLGSVEITMPLKDGHPKGERNSDLDHSELAMFSVADSISVCQNLIHTGLA